ncbi:MAG: DUF3604 domain-containing protein [Acidobacteria bacterium]|jgi:hypothetical protein|nr:DUF3604 domain-containing protein [Acidobacteriota bacterium]
MKTPCAFVIIAALAGAAQAQQDLSIEPEEVTLGRKEYSPYLHRGYPQRVFWGDTHLHTSYSTDAGMIGCVLGPEEAYRFARGETVVASSGQRVRLQRPLDFLVVADHAENLGLAPMIAESDPELLRTEFGKEIHGLVKGGDPMGAYALWGRYMAERDDPLKDNDALTRSVWERITSYAEEYNQPGVFTALIGYEWTSSPGGNNLHRNVVFRGDKSRADRIIPFSNYDSTDPEDLWAWMAAYEEETGDRLLAIPHNGNLSNGLMFDAVTLTDRTPLDRDYAERRMRWEPIYEVTQIKGDGEAHPSLSPNDEFADYGTWDRGSFAAAKDPDMIPREYAREALKQGLAWDAKLGANPFKFGMIGSTDSHTGLATTQEDNFFGKATPVEPGAPDRYDEKITGVIESPDGREYAIRHYQGLASGLAAVWATENTREGLFDAMRRKEVYATTGTRLTVRVFAGWDFAPDEVDRPDFAEAGYTRGVPMGGDLTSAPEGAAPRFMIRALRDPDGANLDRVQIVKGWLDADGSLKEKVHDVVWSGDRKPGADGKLPPVGNTVEGARYTNSIGEALLMGYWRDPDFDPSERAVYYVRVLEIPTPTWLAYDKAFYGDAVEIPEDGVMVQQERAYTSPIWYTP